jgi:NAD(P)-dependent dehydrogenase (short-subunit alcohol dehydrogenase family)
MMSDTMADRIAVIAGASTGVGRAAAVRFAADGATVVLLARREKLLDELAAEIGPSARPIVTDVTDSGSVRAAFGQVAAEFGRIDALVNSAGITRIKAIEEATDADIAESVGTNLVGPIYTTRSAIPLLRAAGGGNLINISSEITLDHMPLMTLYSASKHGLNGFTAAMTRELRKDAIRVTLVILGAVGDTGVYENFGEGALEKAWPIWEADGYLTRMSGSHQLLSATVGDVLHHIVTRPPELMLDVVHVRPAPAGG